ncbi:aspartyl-tRNA synthetase [endosymbiont of Euscepes postfasciatus]|uniref:aspartate--tRNA ligase n=1 Tax=endosymbiont of Euscepes postfasciatus TaxID=650377 RepID=UPI000DC702EB|nr:aspartate--tRNA ligase [endosymbiont of Euscepes postfasciatus]BBA84741.1 aspartyl-tRNA synthetase [endosymbiont of Euscepes postfasciatus]
MRKLFCKDIKNIYLNKKIILYGWIQNKIIFKNFIVIILRDNSGTIKLNILKENFKLYILNIIYNLNIESCIKIIGLVFLNSKHIIEINVKKFFLISKSDKLPIDINNKNISEKNKLKFRYLYLRRSNILNNLKIKSKIIWYINYFMNKNKYIYIETPILSKPTLEGANNFLIRNYLKNKYMALSQSPQIFKQMLMISGVNKYYQLAKCFRNEDLRKDRQPEFTQLDIESSFVNEDYIINLSNKLICFLFKKILNIDVKNNILEINYNKSIEMYGSEKPDLRNPLKIYNLVNILIENNFYIENNHDFIYIIPIKNNIDIKNNYNYILNYFKDIKCYIVNKFKFNEEILKIKINFINNFNINIIKNIFINSIENYNYSFFIVFISSYDCIFNIGKFIKNLSIKLNLINKKVYSLLWIKYFPMFVKKNNNYECVHHPFTSPKFFNKNIDIIKDPDKIISNSYDLIINGVEIASGSVRINNQILQRKVFNILNISKKDQNKNFGFFLNSLKYGTPPHSGIAFGLDRLIMVMKNIDNIKDVIAFPKSSSFYDFITE